MMGELLSVGSGTAKNHRLMVEENIKTNDFHHLAGKSSAWKCDK